MARTEEFRAACSGGPCGAEIVGGSLDAFVDQAVAHARDVHGVEDPEELDRVAAFARSQAEAQVGSG